MGNDKQLKKVYLVSDYNVDNDYGNLEETLEGEDIEAFSTLKAAEQHACHLIQEMIEDTDLIDVSEEDDAKFAFKLNEMISKENYGRALKAFNDWEDEDRYGDFKMLVVEMELSSPLKPKVFDTKFFTGLPDPEQQKLEEWQDQVGNGSTKLGYDAWKKEQAD